MPPEMTFAGVTTGKNKPGRKLTKSLFRQVLEERLYTDSTCDDYCFKDKGIQILGWINYFWQNCCTDIDDLCNNGTYFENDGQHYHTTIHVLWKKGNDYRRTIVVDYEDAYEEIQKMSQLFLGDFCF